MPKIPEKSRDFLLFSPSNRQLNILWSSWEIPEFGEFPRYFCGYNGYKRGYMPG